MVGIVLTERQRFILGALEIGNDVWIQSPHGGEPVRVMPTPRGARSVDWLLSLGWRGVNHPEIVW